MKINKIIVKTSQKKYPIYIGPNIISSLKKILLKEKIDFKKTLIVIDKKIKKKFIKKVLRGLNDKKNFIIYFKSNESNKNFDEVERILNFLLSKNFSRNDCVISIGGGILGDLAGFASSIYKRGIKFINIPTTLLSQVDASIGGKTGINQKKFGKNLIGSFYQPEIVLSDTEFLKTLNRKELICGYAEIFKHSLIDGIKNFKYLDRNSDKILKLKEPFLTDSILYSCRIKKKIVEMDVSEKNIRKSLNLGHTFGHAYEAAAGYKNKLNHGEGVILGIKSAIKFSLQRKIISQKSYCQILDHIESINFNLKLKDFFNKKDIAKLLKFMMNDKKNKSNKINLILIKEIGIPIIDRTFPIKDIKKFFTTELIDF